MEMKTEQNSRATSEKKKEANAKVKTEAYGVYLNGLN
jgi:hypothetical protein